MHLNVLLWRELLWLYSRLNLRRVLQDRGMQASYRKIILCTISYRAMVLLNYTLVDIGALPSLNNIAFIDICYNGTLYMFPVKNLQWALHMFPVIWIDFVKKHYTCFEYFKQVLSRWLCYFLCTALMLNQKNPDDINIC